MNVWRLFVGNMGSGKSKRLIDEIEFYSHQIKHQNEMLVFKPVADTRSVGWIGSRDGRRISAHEVKSFEEILDMTQWFKDIKIIFIDELQFLEKKGLKELYIHCKKKEIGLMASGLDLTSELTPFATTAAFMCYVDYVRVVRGKCEACGADSRLSQFKGTKSEEIRIGATEYAGVCEGCHSEIGGFKYGKSVITTRKHNCID